MPLVRLKPTPPGSQVEHSTTEHLHSSPCLQSSKARVTIFLKIRFHHVKENGIDPDQLRSQLNRIYTVLNNVVLMSMRRHDVTSTSI